MFPGYPENREHSANIPGLLRAGWEMRVHVDGFMHV